MGNKIEFDGTGDGMVDNGVHFISAMNVDYTLCGITLDLDSKTAGGFNATNKKVDCENCIRIVKFCKNIRSTDFAS